MGQKNNEHHTTDNQPVDICSVDALMQQAVTEHVFPGAVLLVSRNGSILLHNAYGTADFFTQRAMTTETIFDLASLTASKARRMTSGELDAVVGRNAVVPPPA